MRLIGCPTLTAGSAVIERYRVGQNDRLSGGSGPLSVAISNHGTMGTILNDFTSQRSHIAIFAVHGLQVSGRLMGAVDIHAPNA